MGNGRRWMYGGLWIAGLVALVLWRRDLGVPLVLLGWVGGGALYARLPVAGRAPRLLAGGLLLAAALAGLYFAGDALLFPHSPYAPHRLHDALCTGAISAAGGLLTAWGIPRPGPRPVAQGGTP